MARVIASVPCKDPATFGRPGHCPNSPRRQQLRAWERVFRVTKAACLEGFGQRCHAEKLMAPYNPQLRQHCAYLQHRRDHRQISMPKIIRLQARRLSRPCIAVQRKHRMEAWPVWQDGPITPRISPGGPARDRNTSQDPP
ncbi:hypothetical protein [Paracoccus salsus]|uniref:hypothetical protein n=1 Tax=Paracoccus salsus TaxID=2911061 RepID=UPI001F17448B|nr:hypothetical protein [Paracoccus salsus]MCF3973884.1 hypothetical protein [Paracoccus salsus]